MADKFFAFLVSFAVKWHIGCDDHSTLSPSYRENCIAEKLPDCVGLHFRPPAGNLSSDRQGKKHLYNLLVDFSKSFYTSKIALGVKPLSEALYTDYKKYDE